MKESSFNIYRIYIYLRQRMGFLWLGTESSLLYANCLLSILVTLPITKNIKFQKCAGMSLNGFIFEKINDNFK